MAIFPVSFPFVFDDELTELTRWLAFAGHTKLLAKFCAASFMARCHRQMFLRGATDEFTASRDVKDFTRVEMELWLSGGVRDTTVHGISLCEIAGGSVISLRLQFKFVCSEARSLY